MGKRILIVDDDRFSAEVLKMLLKSLSLECDIASTGLECCELLESSPNQYDIVLMDFWMPDMNGLEATRCIKELNLGNVRRIVGLTGDSDSATHRKGLDAGMDEVIVKPVGKDILRRVTQ